MALTRQSFRTAFGAFALAAAMVTSEPRLAQPAGEVASGSVSGLPIPRFVSLKPDRVNVRAGPNKDQEVRWVYTHAGMPVEITAEFENWRRIRDWEGAEGWVYHSLLSGRRTAMVLTKSKDELVPLFESADIESEIIASLEILLAAGADVNAAVTDTQSRSARIARPSSMTDRLGQTALHQAAGRGWAEVVAYLLEHGADPAVTDALGRTPLDLATTAVQGRQVPNSERIAGTLRARAATP